MKLVIAEKPSVAQSIARVIGAAGRKDGYLMGNGYLVKGSFLVMDFETRKELDEYLENEPYVTASVWQDIKIETCNVVIR